MIYRIINKVARIAYLAMHPSLWNKHMGVYGIPNIRSYKNIKFGEYCTINPNVYIQGSGGAIFGDYVTLSRDVKILTVGIDTTGYKETCLSPVRTHKLQRVIIGDGVWLGAGSMVMPGVTIAPRIIVAAGAVVSGNLDKEGWLYAGVPAKPIKELK